MALRVVIIFRMTATIMTLGFLLIAARREYGARSAARRAQLNRVAKCQLSEE